MAVLHAALAIDGFGGTGGDFLLFDFLVRDSAGDDVYKEFEVVEAGYGVGCGMLGMGRRKGEGKVQRSRYWMLRRGFRSDLTTL